MFPRQQQQEEEQQSFFKDLWAELAVNKELNLLLLLLVQKQILACITYC